MYVLVSRYHLQLRLRVREEVNFVFLTSKGEDIFLTFVLVVVCFGGGGGRGGGEEGVERGPHIPPPEEISSFFLHLCLLPLVFFILAQSAHASPV